VKILVTGGAGFLGSHVCDALTARGHDLIVYDAKPSSYRRDGQKSVVGDILDMDLLRSEIAGCDAVYHFAAIADIAEASRRPLDAVRVNILGTAQLLDTAYRAGVKRFVLASSVYVYSDQGMFYRSTKQASEQLTQDYHQVYGLPYTILRFGSLYGPRAGGENAVYRMLKQALRDGVVSYQGDGEEVREYIHVSDAAEASGDILDARYENGIYHLMGSERLRTRDMLNMIREIIGQHVALKFNEGQRTGHYQQTPYSYSPKLGRRLVRDSYIDLGLGLLQCVEEIDRDRKESGEA